MSLVIRGSFGLDSKGIRNHDGLFQHLCAKNLMKDDLDASSWDPVSKRYRTPEEKRAERAKLFAEAKDFKNYYDSLSAREKADIWKEMDKETE